MLRVAFIAQRRFGVAPRRMLHVLRTLVRQVDAVRDLVPSPPPCLGAKQIFTALLTSEFAMQSTPTPTQRFRRVVPGAPAPQWKALSRDEVGRHQLPPDVIVSAFDPLRVKSPLCRTAPARPPGAAPFTTALRDFTRNAMELGLAVEVDPARNPPSGRVAIIPKNSEKGRAITDLRWLVDRQPCRPRRFRLPSLEWLKPLLLSNVLHFCVLDVSNYFPSLLLPDPPAAPYFDCSPVIADRLSESIADPVLRRFAGWVYVYIDDFLVVGVDPAGTQRAAVDLAAGMRARALVPSARKCRGLPPAPPLREAEWLGKEVRNLPDPRIAPTPAAAADVLALTVIALALPLDRRGRQQLTGCITWAGIQH
eukprot:gene6927-5364_t